jgi:hypothetical protein
MISNFVFLLIILMLINVNSTNKTCKIISFRGGGDLGKFKDY